MKKTFIKKLGNYDNPVFSRLAKVFELIILNFLWVAASLPIITIGSATAAMYYTIAKHIRHERGTLVKSFIASFRENLLPGIALTTILAAIVAFLFVDYYCYPFLGEGSVSGSIYLLLLVALATFVLLAVPYVFPVLSRFHVSVLGCIRYSLSFALRYLPWSLLMAAFMAGFVYSVLVIPHLLFVLPSLLGYVSSFFCERAFREQIAGDGGGEEGRDIPEWYEE